MKTLLALFICALFASSANAQISKDSLVGTWKHLDMCKDSMTYNAYEFIFEPNNICSYYTGEEPTELSKGGAFYSLVFKGTFELMPSLKEIQVYINGDKNDILKIIVVSFSKNRLTVSDESGNKMQLRKSEGL